MTPALQEGIDRALDGMAQRELASIDGLLRHLANEVALPYELDELITRIRGSHRRGAVMSNEDRALCDSWREEVPRG